jgi:hypothetical protein
MHDTLLWLLMLSALAGAIHVLAPDHWVPTSILSWQRRWRPSRAALFAAVALSWHVLLGAGIYFALDGELRRLGPGRVFPYSLGLVVAVMCLRGLRFTRLRDVQRMNVHAGWAYFAVLTFLGPCESIMPVFLKSASLGRGYLLPLAAFWLGTVASGVGLVLVGRLIWNRPHWLIGAFDRLNRRVAVLPVAAGVALGLRYLLRL